MRELVAWAASDDPKQWQAGAEWLAACDGRTWLLLDDHARPFHYLGAMFDQSPRWEGPRVWEPSGFVAAVTSMHHNGHIRQYATQALATIPSRVSTAALAVRCLDYVSEVRAEAQRALTARADAISSERALAVLLAGRRRWHAESTLTAYVALVRDPALLGTLTASEDRTVRRWAFTTLHDVGALSSADLARLATGDNDQFVRTEAVRWLHGVAGPDELTTLLASRYAEARLLAVAELDNAYLGDDVLLNVLDDPAARTREVAQWRARQRGIDVAAAYRARLTEDMAPSRLSACLVALGELGSAADVAAITPYLGHPSAGVRASAVRAVASVADGSIAPLLTPMLHDGSPRVATAAARALSRLSWDAADVEAAWASPQSWTRRAAWQLARSSAGWARVVADLRAASDEDETLAGIGRMSLRNWLRADAATTMGRLAPDTVAFMLRLLPASGLPAKERDVIAFHAGLPRRRWS